MYVKPEVSKYSGGELLDLMGPVETGYCDIDVREDRVCNVTVRVYPDEGSNLEDYIEQLGWRVVPDRSGDCSGDGNSGVIPGPADECFDPSPEASDGNLLVTVNMCCLTECGPRGIEDWTLGLTLFDEDGPKDTCEAEVEVWDE